MFIPYFTRGANLTLKGSISVRGEYDDNIFLSSDNEVDDFMTTLTPEISGQYKLDEKNYVDLLYSSDLIFHKKNTPSVDDEKRHNFKGIIDLNPFEHFFLNIKDDYSLIQIDTREPGRFKGRFNNLAQSNTFQINPSFKYNLSPTAYTNLEMSYVKTTVNSRGINEKEEWNSIFEIGKNFSSTIKGSFNYKYGDTKQTESDDYIYHFIFGKIIYKPTEHMEANMATGFNRRIYSTDEDLNLWNINFNLTDRISPAMDIGLGISRNLEDNQEKRNAEKSATEKTTVNGSINYKVSEQVLVKGNGFYQLNSFEQVNREDELIGGNLSLLIFFSKYLSMSLTGAYNKGNFYSRNEDSAIPLITFDGDVDDRTDKTVSGTGSLEFKPYEWVRFGTRIQSEKRESDALNRDYTVNRLSFYGILVF